MHSFPTVLSLLACLASGLIFFLGFLPVKQVPAKFFSLHSVISCVLWFFIFVRFQHTVFLITACACSLAWHNFRLGKTRLGKIFLAFASGMAVGFGLFQTGIVLPTPGMPPAWIPVAILAVLLAAGTLGSAYLAIASGIAFAAGKIADRDIFQRCLRIFLTVLSLRAALFFSMALTIWLMPADQPLHQTWFDFSQNGPMLLARILAGLIIPAAIGAWFLGRIKAEGRSLSLAPLCLAILFLLLGEYYTFKFGF